MSTPKYTIVAQLFTDKHTLFQLKIAGVTNLIKKTANEITMDANIINAMSNQDAYLIGYVSASEKIFEDIMAVQTS